MGFATLVKAAALGLATSKAVTTSHDLTPDTPEIRKYKKRFYSEILCAKILLGVILRVSFKLKFESTVQLFVTKESQ